MKKEPLKPACVPAEAVWNEQDYEWETGEHDANGNPVGEWKWWVAPLGYLVCHTIYTGKKDFTYTRFHPDGTTSQTGQYVNGMLDGIYTCIRSNQATMEHFSPNAGEDVWKAVATIKENVTLEEHYYDREGNEVQEPYYSEVQAEEVPQIIKRISQVKANITDKLWHKALAELNDIKNDGLLTDEFEEMEFLYYQSVCLYEQGGEKLTPEIIENAKQILQCYNFQLWDYLSGHNILRTAIRTAYHFLALNELTANTEQNTDNALEYVNKLKNIYSPIEGDNVFDIYYETIAQTLIRKYSYNTDYKLEVMVALKKFEKSGLSPKQQEIKAALQSADYIDFKNNNPLEALKKGPANETWLQAFDRYKKLLILLNLEEEEKFQYDKTCKPEELKQFEKINDCNMPDSLQNMYIQQGALTIGEGDYWNSFLIIKAENMLTKEGLIDSIDSFWGGRDEFEEFTTEQRDLLNKNYFVFGMLYIDDNQHVYLYFDRHGKFDTIYFDQDDFFMDVFYKMLDKSPANNTLDEVISSIIDSMAQVIIEENE